MNLTELFFISSGILLGWSLGANHASGLFGTAVISKMVKFKLAAVIAGIFVIYGAVAGGAGAAKTLNDLGAINALAGSFTVALAVAASITWMTKLKLPASTSQAVVGAIIGWNIFTGSPTDITSLTKIFITWVTSPLLAGVFGFFLFKLAKKFLYKARIHLLELDAYTRVGLIIVGAFASYSLGANNIANVMGLFVSSSSFKEINIYNLFAFSGMQQLFLIGGVAIAIGIYTYGYSVMVTVGNDLYKTTPVSGLIVVLAESLVLFIFASEGLESLLINMGLPPVPLVPLSSTQAVIGAVIGVGLAKDGKGINYKVLGKIASGWIIAPIAAGIISFVALFFVQNVFEQQVVKPVPYELSSSIIQRLAKEGIAVKEIMELKDKKYFSTKSFRKALLEKRNYKESELFTISRLAIVENYKVDSNYVVKNFDTTAFARQEINSLKLLHGRTFKHKYDIEAALDDMGDLWKPKGDLLKDKELENKKNTLLELLRVKQK